METIQNVIFIPEKPKVIEDKFYENCKIKEQNFYKGTIKNCIFNNCDLSESNFSKATIKNCKFINCFMQFSAMVRVNIQNCEFIKCDLWHSNLCHSIVYETLFQDCIIRALFKELNWQNNTFDKKTILESCGGTVCGMDRNIILELVKSSKRTIDIAI